MTASVTGASSVAFLGYSTVVVEIDASVDEDKTKTVYLPNGFTPMSILPGIDATATVTKISDGHWTLTPNVTAGSGKVKIFILGK